MVGRRFNGKDFRLISRHTKKRNAMQSAKEWREEGSLARVVHEDGFWNVYRRVK